MTFEEKLQESGIDKNKAEFYKLSEVQSVLKKTGAGPDAQAIEIPYFGIDGKVLNFSRYRLLKSNKGIFSPITFKYYQPKGSNAEVYLPPSIDWKSVSNDVYENIIITEGEFKAIATSEAGYNCIGLGGVSSFQSKKQGVALLSPLDKFKWQSRQVYIIYDSDLISNINVRMAQYKLAKLLCDLGAKVFTAFVGSDGDSKMGLDDAIVKYGPDVVESLLQKAEPFMLYDEIEKLNEEVMYNIAKGKIYYYNQDVYISVQDFKNRMANRFMYKQTFDSDGEPKIERVNLYKEWMESPLRLTVFDEKFVPDSTETFIQDTESGYMYYNSFSGFEIQPLDKVEGIENKKSVKLFRQLLKFIFSTATEDDLNWFMHWMAEGLRNPNIKMRTAVVIWSNMEGNGKSTIGNLLAKLYGRYASNITSAILKSQYNSFIRNKLFIMSDELTGEEVDNVKDTKRYMDQLKNLITQDEVVINAKYISEYTVKDYAKYFFTSNNVNMISISNFSRRFFIIHAPEEKMPQSFYTDFYNTVFSDEGLREIMTFLLNYEVDKVIALNSDAPATEAKQEIVVNSRTLKQQWFIDLQEAAQNVEPMENSGFICGQIVPEIIALKDLVEAASNALGKGQTMGNIKRSLSKYNIKVFKDKVKLNKKQGSPETIVILANFKKWQNASYDKICEYIKNWRDYVYEP